MSVEILAPAGGEEQLKAAVRCGADAVYLGTGAFNARRNAENFDGFSLESAVAYCHAYGVKVHVTLNTLIKDSEIELVTDEIEKIASSGADAVIVQDLGVMRLLKECAPDTPLHASTQMSIHNLSGALKAKELGFSRVVLARELSLSEIEKITAEAGIETEVFVHGAHCMSVSGMCCLSSVIGERSGNRGLCAQPCRLNFNANGREYALSLKDMCYIDHIKALEDAGVSSFKIEGRMKRPEYVASAVTSYKKALCGEAYDIDTLKSVFSRSGFTDGYYSAKRDLSMFGYRTKDDVISSSEVLSSLTALYRNELSRIKITASLKLFCGATCELTASDGNYTVSASGEAAQKAQNKPADKESAFRSISKTGGTPFSLSEADFTFETDGQSFAAASVLNALRREALDKLYELRSAPKPHTFIKQNKNITPDINADSSRSPLLRLRFNGVSQLCCEDCAEYVYLPSSEIAKHKEIITKLGDKLIAELPALVFPDREADFIALLNELKGAGVRRVCAENIGAVKAAADVGFMIHGGYGLNILNVMALKEYADMGLCDVTASYELSLGEIKAMQSSVKKGILSYGYLPLMKFRACPVQSEKGCAGCSGVTQITDRKNISFTVQCCEKRYSQLLNSVPLYVGDKDLSALDFTTLFFTTESRESCMKIVEAFVSHQAPPVSCTRGLYFREVK